MKLIEGYDFIIDGTGNFPTKSLINDACVMSGKPYSHAGVIGAVAGGDRLSPGPGGD